MDWKRASAIAGAVAGFVAAVTLGAVGIVCLFPGEQPIRSAQQGLLIESASTLRPFASSSTQPLSAIQPRPRTGVGAQDDSRAALSAPADPRLEPSGGLSEDRSANAGIRPPLELPPKVDARLHPIPSESASPRNAALPKSDPKPPLRAPALPAALPTAPSQANGLLTPSEIRRMRLSLRLTHEQEVYWIPVEQALLELSAQQSAMVRAGQDPKDVFGIGAGMRIYSVARPLLDQLREDQKAQVRARARAMGFGSIASSL